MLACEGLKIVQSLWVWESGYQSHSAQSKRKGEKRYLSPKLRQLIARREREERKKERKKERLEKIRIP